MKNTFKGFKKKVLPRVINGRYEREYAIKNNIPARFEIKDSYSKTETVWKEFYNQDWLRKIAVEKYNRSILKYTQKYNLDPDIVRSVMFAENARGHKIGFNKASDLIHASESPLPMNIQKERWSSLIDKNPEDLYDSDNNIEASTILLRRIAERIDKPTPEKVGSIWNYLGREETNDFGRYIGKIYREKPWKKIESFYGE